MSTLADDATLLAYLELAVPKLLTCLEGKPAANYVSPCFLSSLYKLHMLHILCDLAIDVCQKLDNRCCSITLTDAGFT